MINRVFRKTFLAMAVLFSASVYMYGQNFTIEINRIIPQSGPAKVSTDGYTLKIKDSKLTCYLPFIGSSDFGGFGENPAIDVNDQAVTITSEKNEKKECTSYKFKCADKTDTNWDFNVQVYDNGTAYINCTCGSRSPMSYQGSVSDDK